MTDSVRELIRERVDGSIESIVFHSDAGAYYGFVTSLRDDDTAAITTIVLDVDDETLKVHSKNSMWVPADPDTLDQLTRSIARTTSAANGSVDDADTLTESSVGFPVDEMLSYELDDDYSPGDDDGDWKASSGADEMDQVFERLVDSPIQNAERLIRLEFGEKRPWDGEPQRVMRHPDQIGGNYGVEVAEDDELVILDVDDVVQAPTDEIPDTLGCRSPHGGQHYYLHVPGWRETFREQFDVLNPHPEYGEVRSQDGYVVGPGSELTTCKYRDCCTDDDPGTYELVDEPIATIQPDQFVELVAPFRGDQA